MSTQQTNNNQNELFQLEEQLDKLKINKQSELFQLKEQLANLSSEQYDEVINAGKSIKIKKKLIDYLKIDSEYSQKISNLKFECDTNYPDDPNDEYSEFINCEMNISYEYNIRNNENVKVEFEVNYSKTQTYDNRSVPDINCETKLDILNNLNYVDYDYNENKEVINNDLGDEDRSWEYLINKILKEINGCRANWYYFLSYF
jgi:hypothetical protein